MEYRKAVKLDSDHTKSKLRIAAVLNSLGKLKDAAPLINELTRHPEQLSQVDLAQAFYLSCRNNQLMKNWAAALTDIRVSVGIDKSNPDYLLEYYAMRAKAEGLKGEDKAAQAKIKMFTFMREGENNFRAGNYRESLDDFLRARQSDFTAVAPLLRIGDVFFKLGDYSNAAINYKKASDLSKKDPSVFAKYTEALIQGYEWEAAKGALNDLKGLANSGKYFFKCAGDFYAKQKQLTQAQVFYKQALSLDSVDAEVYIAYANVLLDQKKCDEAPFFYAIALRLDPNNRDATVGTAKCYVQQDSIDRGISYLQDEMQKMSSPSVPLLCSIAEFQIQKGSLDQANQNLDQAESIQPDFVEIPKIRAEIYLAKQGKDKKALQKALDYFEIYSEKNPSDPSGYMERYKILLSKKQYESALQELDKVIMVSPKFPGLRMAKAELYLLQGNRSAAILELESEVKNNPGNPKTRLSFAKLLLDSNDIPQAIRQVEEAMKLDPQSAEAKHQLGIIYLVQRNYVAAVALFQGAAQSDPGNPEYYKELVRAYVGLSDNDGATRALQKYQELSPNAPDVKELQKLIQ